MKKLEIFAVKNLHFLSNSSMTVMSVFAVSDISLYFVIVSLFSFSRRT